MKANDLRIGNVVEYKYNLFSITHRISVHDLKDLYENPEAFKKIYKPMDITPQMKIKYSNLLEYHNVKYVHELQNLFFTLRGVELELML